MKYINRWGIMKSSLPENLATHSLEVAEVAHCLALIGNNYFGMNYNEGEITVKAMYHDAAEIFTGDLPTPVKYFNKEMKKAYELVEKSAVDKLISLLPSELTEEYKKIFEYTPQEKMLIKAADKICAYIKCHEEVKVGNQDFVTAEHKLQQSIMSVNCQEANYFMEHFFDGFTQPIDLIIE